MPDEYLNPPDELASLTDQLAALTDELAALTDELAGSPDESAATTDESAESPDELAESPGESAGLPGGWAASGEARLAGRLGGLDSGRAAPAPTHGESHGTNYAYAHCQRPGVDREVGGGRFFGRGRCGGDIPVGR